MTVLVKKEKQVNKTIKTKVSTVTCIQSSKCAVTGKEIFTLECEYPRAVHAQLLTHGVFSKNSSSTRAVPLEAAIKQILENPAKVIWTANQSGMQGKVITDPAQLKIAEDLQKMAMHKAINYARDHATNGVHKQNAGRLLEPFQNIKIVLTSTEWENWDWLRIHEDAQGEIADLAEAMKEARDTAEVMELQPGEWHVPYVERKRLSDDSLVYFLNRDISGTDTLTELSAEQAKAVSMSVCAQVSYRKADASLEKAEKMKGMLVDGHKVHASPFEHQATPISSYTEDEMQLFKVNDPFDFDTWEEGVTHLRRDGKFGSGNFIGWIQHRQLIKNHDGANLS